MTGTTEWEPPETKARENRTSGSADEPRKVVERIKSALSFSEPSSSPESHRPSIWLNPDLTEEEHTANLDDQKPATLFYLGSAVKVEGVQQVYVEKRRDGSLKHWAIIEERDYEAMERLYEIEEDTLDRFPMADLNFRVSVYTDSGPTVSNDAVKIYDAS